MAGNCKSSKKAISPLILVMLWILFSNAHLRAQEIFVDKVFDAAAPSIVQIHTYDKTGAELRQGSGFFIGPRKILTCAHVIEDAHSAMVVSSIRKYYQAIILKMDEDMDLALLMINANGEKSLKLENERIPTRNQYLIALGHNYREHKNYVSYGLAHAVVSEEGTQLVVNSVPIFSGGSGGPLLNIKGFVVGVHRRAWGDGPAVAFSTGIEAIMIFLERPNNPKNLAYTRSSVYWNVVLEKLGECWGAIVSSTREIIKFLFMQGVLRGAYIITLTCILIGWRTPFLLRFIRARKRRKAVNKIIKWSNVASSLEMALAPETKGHKRKHRAFADNRGDKIVVDRAKIEDRVELIMRRCKANSGMTEEIKEL